MVPTTVYVETALRDGFLHVPSQEAAQHEVFALLSVANLRIGEGLHTLQESSIFFKFEAHYRCNPFALSTLLACTEVASPGGIIPKICPKSTTQLTQARCSACRSAESLAQFNGHKPGLGPVTPSEAGEESVRPSGGAPRETRTPDPLITNQLLYQLSYRGSRDRLRAPGAPFKSVHRLARASRATAARPTRITRSAAGAAPERFSRLACSWVRVASVS